MDHCTAYTLYIPQSLYDTAVGNETETMLAKQPWRIQTKMYRLSRKTTIWSFF